MKTTSKWIMIFILLLSVGLAGCSGEDSNKKVIGISLQNFSDEFRTYIIDAMEEEQKKHPDIEFVYADAQNDSSTQKGDIENFVARGVDAIIFTPVDTVAAMDIVNMVNEADIPLIVLNQTFDGADKAAAYVGSESIESGILQMEEVAKLLNGKGNIAIMDGTLGHEAQIKRTEGNMQIIKEHPDMKVVKQGSANWSRPEGMDLMENWMQSSKIDAVVANNDEMAIGAIMALESEGKLKDTVVAGIDATPAALDMMKEGKLKVTVFQDAAGQGKASIETAVKAANGEEVEDAIIPYQLVTPENVDEFAAKYE
ncbi:sugar ABC transporter substrate-binding protein [Domibacillus sp. DTU_2020_1001157_1_SI_ALB_TIR_016]|uniref:sugar ABC transporter substrate-binding protein n=1 Tax=Domibacillus sp. DTU_2020_1001157_1_SI_ALB_TIR_016 TaxID=3077789 RepID=UPI0028ED5D99|nr:sugar ABC transporter substrate-binding protein [Domibacillus sp. DTU_2020_1001157_1_SI_ALB_TIR_016]WNS77797.1 sugar ABC transporter substrate-binding protein [Domibacillus sp. DTU_2020_1001157_1_SI_ALB_TIR_016]